MARSFAYLEELLWNLDGEDIVCDGFIRTGEKIVFTNKHILILEVQQAQSLETIHKPKYNFVSELPINKIKDVYSEVNDISRIAEMVVNIDNDEELRCSFGILISHNLYFGTTTISIPKYNAIVDTYVNEIRRILKKKRIS